jgi:3-oxoacyl-[acyl-carrier-protein] synthase-3
MIGIKEISTYIPKKTVSNLEKIGLFNIDETFIKEKIGVEKRAIKEPNEKASDLCIYAYSRLLEKLHIETKDIDIVVVVTQNPDFNIPHTSAILHKKMQLKNNCICFDLSLGCSGYVQGLAIIKSFMEAHKLKNGLLFTSDQYSDIINKLDKDTSLIFGDAATATLLTDQPDYIMVDFSFGTSGEDFDAIIKKDKYLYMNGRKVFNFVMKTVPDDINKLLKNLNLDKKDIDCYIFHQGSKFIVDMLAKNLNLSDEKVPFDITYYGNTVSSSIPIILEKKLKTNYKHILLSGFGVGLCFANAIIKEVHK